jgi:hypothetical protein
LDNRAYRIHMDGAWGLRDLYEFPHAFMQVYAFIYCFDSPLAPRDADRINDALESYPWAGGYSVVNIYTVLQNQVEHQDRPRIEEIKYASPGWIDVLLNLHPAVKLAGAVAAIAGSLAATAKSYATLQKTFHEVRSGKERNRLDRIKLTREQIQELHGLSEDLARLIGFEQLESLNKRTGNILVTAKLVAAQFRRLKSLADFVLEGKALLPEHGRDQPEG